MGTTQPLSLRGRLEAASATILGVFTLAFGFWLVVMTGYTIAGVLVTIAGAIAFPPTRTTVTFGRLTVGRWLHDVAAFFLWIGVLLIALFVVHPWT